MTTNNQLNAPIPFAINIGGTGVTSVTTAPTASAWSGWDANSNASANNFIAGYTTTATAASSTTLLVGSTYLQYFTGSTTQTVLLPVTSTLVLGQQFYIVNNSSGVVTVQSSGANTIQAMAANTSLLVTCILTSGTTAASWNSQYTIESAITLPLSLANGGTNASLTASNGGIFYSTASAGAILAGTATANQVLLSGSSTTPAWSTATFASTYNVSTLLYASSANAVTGLATADSAVLVTNSSGVPAWSSTMTNGQLIIGYTSGTPTAATLTAGTGVGIANGTGSITISATGGGLTWSTVTGSTQAAAVNNGYVINDTSGASTVTLPATAALGAAVRVVGLSTGMGWVLAANTGQTIQFGSVSSSSAGSWSSGAATDSALAICIVANTTWALMDVVSQQLTKA